MPCYPFLGEGSPTKIDYRKKGILILTSLLKDLEVVVRQLTKRLTFCSTYPCVPSLEFPFSTQNPMYVIIIVIVISRNNIHHYYYYCYYY